MTDPSPVKVLLILEGMGTVASVLWLVMQPAEWRTARLMTIAVREQSRTLPPMTLFDQGSWLVLHRVSWAQQLVAVVVLGLLIGSVEGHVRRVQDVQGGMRLASWTCGVLSLALLPGLAAAWCLWPWPLTSPLLGMGSMLYGGLVSWCLLRGRPYVA